MRINCDKLSKKINLQVQAYSVSLQRGG